MRIFKSGQNTNAFQSNPNLLLSSDARAESVPTLEIEADDVACKHAASIGGIDEDEKFYLLSRGIPVRDTENIIVEGFAAELAQRLPNEELQESLWPSSMAWPSALKMTYDVRKIRADFLLARQVHGKPLVYPDNGATTQKPQAVIDALVQFYTTSNANIHRGNHGLGAEATALYEQARCSVDRFMVPTTATRWSSPATPPRAQPAAQAWGRANVQAGDEILLTEAEHHANFVPWWQLAQEKGAVLKVASLTPEGLIDLASVRSPAEPQDQGPALAVSTFWAAPTAKELIALARTTAPQVIDGLLAPLALHVKEFRGRTSSRFSAHKMLGPTGPASSGASEEVLNRHARPGRAAAA